MPSVYLLSEFLAKKGASFVIPLTTRSSPTMNTHRCGREEGRDEGGKIQKNVLRKAEMCFQRLFHFSPSSWFLLHTRSASNGTSAAL